MAFDILLSPPHMGGDELLLVQEAFASNWIAPVGPMVDAFERDLQELTGIGSVAALSSGTAALHLALRLCEIETDDAVWLPTMTFIGGVAPVLYQGGHPVFFDCQDSTMLLDLDLLENELEKAEREGGLPKVVLTTDLYGHVIDPIRMGGLRARFGFRWVSDAAESVGSRRAGRHAGKDADFAILSFNGNKIITTSGGGALASDDADLIARAQFLSTQARDPAPHYEHTTFGYNYRLSNICAAIGIGQLKVLEDRVAARRRIFDFYAAQLGGISGLLMTPECEDSHVNRWLSTLRIDPAVAGFDREAARLALTEAGIESRPLWKPMHLQPVFEGTEYIGGSVSERAFDHGLCLPSGSAMTDAELQRTCDVILKLSER